MADAYILGAVRTAIGKRGGVLSTTRPDDLAARALKGLVEAVDLDPAHIEDVVMGCVTQTGEQGMNIGRMAPLLAGFPVTVNGTTVNRMCASSLQAVNFAAMGVMSGMHDLTVGAGVESMSRVTMGTDAGPLNEHLTERFDIIPQGLSAELVAERWEITRAAMDAYSLNSHVRALYAIDNGYFDREIVPVTVTAPDGAVVTFATDEGPRRATNLAKLQSLKPAFKSDGVITAGSSSQISDGASAVLVGSAAKADELGLKKRAKFVTMAVAGVDPTIMLSGPIPATRKALEKAGLTLDDIGVFEVNEAFTSVVLAWAKALAGHDSHKLIERTNVNGGAVALGHPLGCSGARLLTTLLHEMERRDERYGLATLSIGFGMAVATIIDRNV